MKVKQVENNLLTTQNIAQIIHDLKTNWGEKKITVQTVHLVLKECMELVDKFDNPGSEKKEHVITIVKAVVKDIVINETDEKLIMELIDKKILENTIDLIVQASKGEFNINNKQTQKKIVSCTKSFIPIAIDIILRIIQGCKSKPSKPSKTITPPNSPTKI